MKHPGGRKALVLGVLVGLAGAGALAYTQLAGASSGPPPVPDPAVGQHGAMLALDGRVVNLVPNGMFRYAKVSITVELRPPTADFYALVGKPRADAEKTILDNAAPSVPLLLDAEGTVISAADPTSMRTAQGRSQLKADLLTAMRGVMGQKVVLDIYFTDFVMQ